MSEKSLFGALAIRVRNATHPYPTPLQGDLEIVVRELCEELDKQLDAMWDATHRNMQSLGGEP